MAKPKPIAEPMSRHEEQYRNAVIRCVAWWVSQSFENYTDREEDLRRMGLDYPLQSQVLKFSNRLEALLFDAYGKGRFANELKTQIEGPCKHLVAACRYSMLSPLYLPENSFTFINAENIIRGRLGTTNDTWFIL